MPLGRIETVLSKVPLISRVTARLDAVRDESAALRASLAPAQSNFDHKAAQYYEITFAERWLRENGDWVWDAVNRAQSGERYLQELILAEFFAKDRTVWEQFSHSLDGKAVLDIGTGPVPAHACWPYAGRKFVIDPLASEYDRLCKAMFGRSWFDGMRLYSVDAEHWVPDLRGAIDGAIVCRNCLDHCREPYLILSNIAAYAAPGCALMFWTDLFHLDGHDHGHTDITRDRDGIRRMVENLGFEIVREVPDSPARGTIQFGCFALKRR